MSELEQAKSWLERDKLRYMDMLEILRRGSADALHVWEEGVLLHDTASGGWFAAHDDGGTLEKMLSLIPPGAEFFIGHNVAGRDRAAQRLGIHGGYTCHQTGWMGETPPELPAGAPPVKRLGQEWAEYLDAHYSHSFGGVEYMRGAIDRGALGLFRGDELAGFISFHDEGSIGMLEVFPKYRRQGLGEILQIAMVRLALEQGKYAYGQVIVDNAPSFALQRKVGMSVCETPMYWLF